MEEGVRRGSGGGQEGIRRGSAGEVLEETCDPLHTFVYLFTSAKEVGADNTGLPKQINPLDR
eukprot:402758-Prorocentrum_minimum.AAC.1